MSSLHQDHLLAEGREPVKGTGSALTSARGSSRKPAEKKVPNEVPTPRRGKAQSEGPASTTTGGPVPAARSRRVAGVKAAAAAGTLAARAKAAGTATTKAASARAATAGAATAKAVSAKAGGAAKAAAAKVAARAATARPTGPTEPATTKPTAARTATAKTATAKTATAKTATAKTATAKTTTKPTAARTATAKTATAKTTTAKTTTAKTATAKTATAKTTTSPESTTTAVRPTPYKRSAEARPAEAAVVPAPAPVIEVEQATEVVATVAEGRRARFLRRPPQIRKRPSLYLAAALVGALSVSGFASGDPAAQATSTVSHSVSVAQELGIEAAPSEQITALDATRRLSVLAASRDVRDAEQAAAAHVQAEADKAAAAAAAEAARPKAVLPVQGARLTSGFGPRWGTLHGGIDLAAPMHTPEYAAMDGVVLEAGPASGFGLAVYIQHANGDVTVYGHMDQILVEPGQVVKAGETIALLGNRGQSTGPHLHFEVHIGGIDGQKVDPIPYLRERGVPI